MDECKPLVPGTVYSKADLEEMVNGTFLDTGRGFHSSTFQLNLSRF